MLSIARARDWSRRCDCLAPRIGMASPSTPATATPRVISPPSSIGMVGLKGRPCAAPITHSAAGRVRIGDLNSTAPTRFASIRDEDRHRALPSGVKRARNSSFRSINSHAGGNAHTMNVYCRDYCRDALLCGVRLKRSQRNAPFTVIQALVLPGDQVCHSLANLPTMLGASDGRACFGRLRTHRRSRVPPAPAA